MQVHRHVTYANVMASVAVVLALGGTSYAAAQLTGANIKDGTVTTKDLKDGTVATRDLAAPVRTLLAHTAAAGPAGPSGPVGATGAAGVNGAPGTNGTNGANGTNGTTGPAGPVHWKVASDGVHSNIAGATDLASTSISVPAGSWTLSLTGTIHASSSGAGSLTCVPVINNTVITFLAFSVPAGGNASLPVVESLAVTPAATTSYAALLRCTPSVSNMNVTRSTIQLLALPG